MEGLLDTPIVKNLGNIYIGKTIGQFKTELLQRISELTDNYRPIYLAMPGSSSIVSNLDNDNAVITASSDLVLWITCITPSADYGHIEFLSYSFKERKCTLISNGIIKPY